MKRIRLTLVLAALAAAVTLAPAIRAEERANVPEKYKWNTADLYATEDAWSKAKDEIAARIPKMSAFQGKLGESAASFNAALSEIEDLDRDLSRLAVYANMRSDEDTRVGKTREMNQAANQLAVQFYAAISYLRPEILAIGSEKVNGFIAAEPKLAQYKPLLDDILRYAPHTLTAAEEKVSSEAAIMADAAGNCYRTFTSADLPYPSIKLSSGETVRLDAQGYTKYRASGVRADRDSVFQAFWTRYLDFERTLGTTLDGNVKAHMFDKTVHKYGSSLEAALFNSNVPVSVYKQLIADVHTNLPTLHRYLRLRQRMMGVDQLRYEDLYASIVKKVDLRYTPEQAMDLVLKAVAPLGPDYVSVLKGGFDSRWVDFVPTTGKRSGAYSTGVYGVHPYQLQNFTGLYEEVSTLAHESGHSMHTYLSAKNQPYASSDYKIFVAEVASTLNENLLLHYMLDQTKDRDTRLFLLGSYLDGMRTTLFRQTLFAEFEMKMHEMAEAGQPLTGEKLSELYLGLLKDYYGDAKGVCKINDLYRIEWAYIPHFYRNFYVFQYATSLTASQQIAANMRADAAAKKPLTTARDAYLKMLSSGSSKYPIDLLKGANVDMTTSGPFNAAITEMNVIMDEMEKLLK
ncbi:MAG: oligoendopeptidase F [Candidatus Eisenbacteria bacterium]|nr:oligoendopeptidase F [Candidatus Eisenbacteria bacterium]